MALILWSAIRDSVFFYRLFLFICHVYFFSRWQWLQMCQAGAVKTKASIQLHHCIFIPQQCACSRALKWNGERGANKSHWRISSLFIPTTIYTYIYILFRNTREINLKSKSEQANKCVHQCEIARMHSLWCAYYLKIIYVRFMQRNDKQRILFVASYGSIKCHCIRIEIVNWIYKHRQCDYHE